MARALNPQTEGEFSSENRPLARAPVIEVRASWLGWLRSSEWLLLAFFCCTVVFSARTIPSPGTLAWRSGLTLAGAALMFFLASAERRTGSKFLSIVRDWLPLSLILVAYHSADWYAPPPQDGFEHAWIQLDRLILDGWGGRAAVEVFGPVLPYLVELCYCLLWAIPPFSVGVLYLYRRRDRVDRFLFTLLLGTLVTYALLPHFPSASPRQLFPRQDLPAFSSPFRSFNTWMLDRYDIQVSVFPSGHVTVAFSAAFAMLLALPERRRVGFILFVLAIGVSIATTYGRYHYAVDGLAGLAVSLLACVVSVLLGPALRRTALRGRSL
jgi:membrane-associated phospholipid phosphatase